MARKCSFKLCCPATTLAIIVVIFAVLVILYFTVFKPKPPEFTTSAVTLDNIVFSVPLAQLNITLGVELSIGNRNYAAFRYRNTTTYVYYNEDVVAEAFVPAGTVRERSTEKVNVNVNVRADELALDPGFWVGVIAGDALELSSSTDVAGDVVVLRIFKLSLRISVTCWITVDVLDADVESSCTTKVNF